MQNYMKTILSAFKTWVESKIKDNQRQADEKIDKVNKNIDNNVVELSKRIDNSTADWTQNDASADNYVKNRTHWEETTETVILPETTVEGFSLLHEPLYAAINAFYFEPELNKTYTITWDGIGYDVELKEFDGLACLGNENYVDTNGGGDIPFALIFAGNIFVVTESTKASHTIAITTSETVVHKIDQKYLPISTPDWNQNNPEGEGYIKNRPFYEEAEYYTYVPEQTVTLSGSGSWLSASLEGESMPWEGNFRVTFDGIVYDDIPMNDNGDDAWLNIAVNGEYISIYQYCRISAPSSFAGDHTIKVEQKQALVTTIENKYLGFPVYSGENKTSVRINDVNNVASEWYSHAEGQNTTASGYAAHAEGSRTTASGQNSHAEGYGTNASGNDSHAEGSDTTASGNYSHAEGQSTTAQARSQHVSGEYNIVEDKYRQIITKTSYNTYMGSVSSMYYSTTFSFDKDTGNYTLTGTVSSNPANDVFLTIGYYFISGSSSGTTMYYNDEKCYKSGSSLYLYSGGTRYYSQSVLDNRGQYAEIVGNGTYSVPSNARTLDWEGNAWYAGDVYVGSVSGINKDEGSKKLVTKDETLSLIEIPTESFGIYNSSDICYNGEKYVCINSVPKVGGDVFISSNGLNNWEKVATLNVPGLPSWSPSWSLVYGNGKFVCVNSSGYIYMSIDGLIWNEIDVSNYEYRNIIYADNKFVTVHNQGVRISEDGINWKNIDLEYRRESKIGYGDGVFIIVDSSKYEEVYYSTDCISWEKRTVPKGNWATIAYGNGTFVSTSNGGESIYSQDKGETWIFKQLPIDRVLGLSYVNGLFIALSLNGIICSNDGQTWTHVYTNRLDNYPETATYDNKKFLITYGDKDEGKLKTLWSYDGQIWNQTYKIFFQNNINQNDSIHKEILLNYIDHTLSVKNYFADAKTVGDRINAPKQSFLLTDNESNFVYNVYMKNGNLRSICRCVRIEVTTLPDKICNENGEFDPTGMVVTLYREDGSSEVIENYTYSVKDALSGDVDISYVEFGCTYTTNIKNILSTDFNCIVINDSVNNYTKYTFEPSEVAIDSGKCFAMLIDVDSLEDVTIENMEVK